MNAILLAAGLGTRLHPLTKALPKCMMPICGRPLLEYWLRLLTDAGIDRIVVNVHYMSGLVEAWIEQSPYTSRVHIFREAKLLNTGGTVLANRAVADGGPLLVIHADNLSHFDVKSFLSRHQNRPRQCDMTMMTYETDSPRSAGIVDVDSQGVVLRMHEKVDNPPGTLANGAVYIFEPKVLDFLETLGKPEIDISREVLPKFFGRTATFHNSIYHRDIGTVSSLLLAQFEYPLRLQALGLQANPVFSMQTWNSRSTITFLQELQYCLNGMAH